MGMRGRDFLPPMGRRDPMPLPPPLGGGSMRGSNNSMRGSSGGIGGLGGGFDSMFSRRSPQRSGNGMNRFRLVV